MNWGRVWLEVLSFTYNAEASGFWMQSLGFRVKLVGLRFLEGFRGNSKVYRIIAFWASV